MIVDEMQIAFIMCVNNQQYCDECVRYINDLIIPEGYTIDVIQVQYADSMASGYNASMKASSAKYKVYLHQDTFILNTNFIIDVLRIFKSDINIGMIGVLGGNLPKNATCAMKWNVGLTMAYDTIRYGRAVRYQDESCEYLEVEAIDGMIMITQYDVMWREDIFDGWHFYDVSQSMEMKRNGYKIVIPYQKAPWCHHDSGVSKWAMYDVYRIKFLSEYFDMTEDIETSKEELWLEENKKIEEIMLIVNQSIEAGLYDKLEKLANKLRERCPLDTSICEFVNIMEIYSLEKMSEVGIVSGLFACRSWKDLYDTYREIRFILLRMSLEKSDERIEELMELVRSGVISKEMIRKILNFWLE